MNARSLNKVYGDWFGSIITKAASEPGERKATLFVTLTFEKDGSGRRRRLAEGQPEGRLELDAFSHLYNRVCRDLIGRNYHRESHQHLLPNVVAFIDAEGSRFWTSKREFENLHIHSIWVAPESWRDLLPENLKDHLVRQGGSTRFDAIDVREIDSDRNVDRVAGYASKLIGFNQVDLSIAEDFRVYPLRGLVAA